MAKNYKHLYELMKKMVDMYQDEIVPGMREQLEKCVEVVRCKDCKHLEITGCYGECRRNVRIVYPWDFCSYGERKDNVQR